MDKPDHHLSNEITKAFEKRGAEFIIREYDQFHKMGLLLGAYTLLEESLRRISEAFDPTFMNKPRSLYALTNNLLSKLGLTIHSSLFDLQRTLRNTIHNNTVFLPDDGQDRIIQWKGNTYTFLVGKRPGIVSWEFLADHLVDISDALADIVVNSRIRTLPDIHRVPR